MKKLEELGISPAPWQFIPRDEIGGDVKCSWRGIARKRRHTVVVRDAYIDDARFIAAAPELYKWLAFAVEQYKCETRSCNNCPNGKCWVVDATAALAKASGESEAHDE